MSFKQYSRGFTLIELLVVIAIIGILSSVIIASLSVGRTRARDARRFSDMKQLRTALDAYADDVREFPNSLSILAPDYISTIPLNPSGGSYDYFNLQESGASRIACTTGGAAKCNTYVLGVGVEGGIAALPGDDRDGTIGSAADSLDCADSPVTLPKYCVVP